MLTRLRIMPRWFIFCLDIMVVANAILLAYGLRFNFDAYALSHINIGLSLGIVVLSNMIAFWAFRNHIGIVRYTAVSDTMRLLQICLITSTFFWIIGRAFGGVYPLLFPGSVVAINFFLSFSLLFGYRLLVRAVLQKNQFLINKTKSYPKAVIYGGSAEAVLAGQVFSSSPQAPFRLVAFVDADRARMRIVGLPVVSPDEQSLKTLAAQGVECVLVPDYTSGGMELGDFLDLAFRCGIRNVRKLPPVQDWMDGKLQANQLKEIRIEDLLERAPIRIENKKISDSIRGKRVLVTGAAGSIGSEVVRQIIRLRPSTVILVDVAESPLHELLLELREMHIPNCNIYPMIGDITDRSRMEYVFDIYHPELVFHAAAYKHVPLMEDNPSIAVLNNVLGTRNLVELSVSAGVETFVLVSTDKAVNPTNVMGASKRIAEIYMQSLSRSMSGLGDGSPKTKFITTRFGNVLGSNGSVIPRFKQQIAAGGPVTVTHPDINRFFMTIAEACQLVIEASVMGEGGEIFVFDMGEPVKVVDLAEKMIRLSGKEPGRDIKISFTGLRPGEKLYEEVLAKAEETVPTYHKKILIAKVRTYDLETVTSQVDALVASARMHYVIETVQKMKALVPEFVSKNSPFERLDTAASAPVKDAATTQVKTPSHAVAVAVEEVVASNLQRGTKVAEQVPDNVAPLSQSLTSPIGSSSETEVPTRLSTSRTHPETSGEALHTGFNLEVEPFEELGEDLSALPLPNETLQIALNDAANPAFSLEVEPFENQSVETAALLLPLIEPSEEVVENPALLHLEPTPFEETVTATLPFDLALEPFIDTPQPPAETEQPSANAGDFPPVPAFVPESGVFAHNEATAFSLESQPSEAEVPLMTPDLEEQPYEAETGISETMEGEIGALEQKAEIDFATSLPVTESAEETEQEPVAALEPSANEHGREATTDADFEPKTEEEVAPEQPLLLEQAAYEEAVFESLHAGTGFPTPNGELPSPLTATETLIAKAHKAPSVPQTPDPAMPAPPANKIVAGARPTPKPAEPAGAVAGEKRSRGWGRTR